MEEFRGEGLYRTISQEARDAICDLTLGWGHLDTMVTHLFALSFSLDMDIASILVGNMETKTKLERLRSLLDHLGLKSRADDVHKLNKAHLNHSKIRNIVTHHYCVGMVENDTLVFTSWKHIQGDPGTFEIVKINVPRIRNAASFANKAEEEIKAMIRRSELPQKQQ